MPSEGDSAKSDRYRTKIQRLNWFFIKKDKIFIQCKTNLAITIRFAKMERTECVTLQLEVDVRNKKDKFQSGYLSSLSVILSFHSGSRKTLQQNNIACTNKLEKDLKQ